jgi:glycosyltransferase involved in cell wall biosynthesis
MSLSPKLMNPSANIRCESPARMVLVVPQAEPRSGMELAATRLAAALQSTTRRLRVVVLSGGAGDFANTAGMRVSLLRAGRTPVRLVVAALRLRIGLRIPPGSVIVAVGIWAAIPVLLVFPRRRVVVWEHSLSSWRVSHDWRVRLLAGLARWLYPRASTIVAVSEATASAVRELAPSARVTVIPNLLDPNLAVSSPEAKQRSTVEPRRTGRTLLVLGSLTERKNVSLALRALALLPREYHLTVAGDGPLRPQLEREARDLQVGERVCFVGHTAHAWTLLQRSDVLVHPALDETFGYVLVEAVAAARPVVALDRPNMNMLIPHFVPGVLVETGDAGGFAAAIETVATSVWRAEVYEAASARLAARHSEEVVLLAWLSVLDDGLWTINRPEDGPQSMPPGCIRADPKSRIAPSAPERGKTPERPSAKL